MPSILFISQNYSTHARRFLSGLVGAGHEVWFLPCKANRGGPELGMYPVPGKCLPELGVNGSSFGDAEFRDLCLRLRKILDDVKPSLVLAGPVHTGGYLAALVDFHPLVVMSWGDDVLTVAQSSESLRAVAKFTLSRADAILGDCEAVRDAASSIGEIPRERIACFPWGVDLERFRPDAHAFGLRGRLGWQNGRIIVTARPLEPFHGTMFFLDGMRQVLERQADARVVMLGDGSLRPSVEAFIEQYRLRDKIHVAGQVPEEILPQYFVEADLYVSATQCDGSSISLLEAMGCGLAAIVPDIGGNKEWVTDGHNGWLYSVGNKGGLVTATLRALTNDAMRREMGRTNVSMTRERADWRRNLSKLLALCDRLIPISLYREMPAYAELQNR